MEIPPKVKVFFWRALKNFIPTEGNLRRHHIPTEGICTLCRDRWAPTVHSLIFCPQIKTIWKILKEGEMVEIEIIGEAIRANFETNEYGLWCMSLWRVWMYLCFRRHAEEGERSKPTEEGCEVMRAAYCEAKEARGGRQTRDFHCGDR